MIRAFSTHCTQHQTHKIGWRRKCRADQNNVGDIRTKDTYTHSHKQRYLKRNNLKISLDLLRFKENGKSRAEKMRTRTRVLYIPSIQTYCSMYVHLFRYFVLFVHVNRTDMYTCRLVEATNNKVVQLKKFFAV